MDASSSSFHTSSSGASSSGTSTSTFPDFTHDFNIGDFEAHGLDIEHRDQSTEGPTAFGPTGANEALGGFFDFGRMGNFELGLGQADLSALDPFSYGGGFSQQDLGLGLGPGLGVDLANTTFPQLGILDFDTPLEVEPLPNRTSPWSAAVSQSALETSDSNSGDEQTQLQKPADGNTNNQKDSTPADGTYPARNPLLRLHTPPEITAESTSPTDALVTSQAEAVAPNASLAPSTSPAKSKPKPRPKRKAKSGLYRIPHVLYPYPPPPPGAPGDPILRVLGLPPFALDPGSRAGSRRSRNTRTPHISAAQAKKEKEKALKAKAAEDRIVWHVITPQTASSVNSDPATASGSGTTDVDPGSASGSNSGGKRPGRRKEVFQHVEAPSTEKSGKPDWFVDPPPWNPPPPPPLKPRKNLITKDTHSDMGWVLARLREPDCERPQYGWAIAQVHDPRASSYLVLSGPHVTKVKTVRAYDRVAYSPDAIAQLKERCQESSRGKGPGAKGEKVYDTITLDPGVLARHSSVFGVDQATEGIFTLRSVG